MPKPRPSRPPAAPSPPPALVRLVQENWPLIQWKQAVEDEAWRLVYAEGGNCCGAAEYERGRQSLRDQGYDRPPGFDDG